MNFSVEASNSNDINTFFGTCKCCLENGYMKNMWTEHYWENNREIYGEMLMETFSITLETEEDTKEYICEFCILRLRDAHNFKKEVLGAKKQMFEEFGGLENEDVYKIEALDSEEFECLEKIPGEVDQHLSETEYYDIEYLEDEDFDIKKEIMDENSDFVYENPKHTTKRTRGKNKRNTAGGTYKSYTELDMRKCLDAVRSKRMNVSEASKFYGIPRKTVSMKLYNEINKKLDTPEDKQKYKNQEKQFNFVEELKLVLTFTNAVPFKVKGSRCYCAFCYLRTDSFEDPDDLRIHFREHDGEFAKNLEHMLRPHFLNEIVRLDIESFCCKICSVPIKSWNDMFIHFKEQHDIVMDQSYTRLIPYRLRRDTVHCALCEQRFPNFYYLDVHMNLHYCNYMCSDCGDTFLTETRLKHHLLIHNTGRFPCEECGKVFSLEKYMKKHIAVVHKRFKSFKCMYCTERFHSEYERHTHVVDKHNEKIRISTCELCGRTFDWKPYYLAHLRKVHRKEKKHKCKFCNKGFVAKHEVKIHEQRHTGSGKHFCSECGRNFVTMMELKSHFKRHLKERSEQKKK